MANHAPPLISPDRTQVRRGWPTGGPPLFNTSQGPALEGESRKGPPLGAPPTLPGRRSRTTGRNEAAKQGTERTGNPGQGPPTCAHPGGSQRPPFRPILDPRQVVRVAYRKTPPFQHQPGTSPGRRIKERAPSRRTPHTTREERNYYAGKNEAAG